VIDCAATSTYCSGVKRINAQNRARWSPSRVGVIVMNSRSATNEINPNIATDSPSPMNRAVASSAHIIHQARRRRLNVRIAAALRPVSGNRFRNWPTIVAIVKRSRTPPTSDKVFQSSISGRRRQGVGRRGQEAGGRGRGQRPLDLLQTPHRFAGPLQEVVLGLSSFQPDRRAEGDAA